MGTQLTLEKAIERLDPRGMTSFPDLFYNFLDLQLSFLCNNPSEEQNRLRIRVCEDDQYRQALIDAMRCYGEAAEDYHDPLGDIFMYRISHGHNGQFFTPEHICDFMARITDPSKERIADPCCGSGRLLLAALKISRENGYEPQLYANDISITCSKMALLNILINCAGGEVTCGDGLKLDYENYLFYKIDRIRPFFGGAAISTYWQYTLNNITDVEKMRTAWWEARYSEGWISANQPTKSDSKPTTKADNIIPEPLPMEIKVDSNGQLSLF